MKRMIVGVVAVMLASGVAGMVARGEDAPAADAKAKKEQTTCPVMGGKIDKNLYVDANGKRIYICCKGCIGAIKKDPAKYIKKMEDAGVTLEAAPADTNAVKAADAPAKAN